MLKDTRGFTLIELLVVMSIISTLSSTVLVATSNLRLKARDSQRISNLTEIQNALELYYNKYGYYPSVDDSARDVTTWYSCPAYGSAGGDDTIRDGYDCSGYRVSSVGASWSKLQTDLSEFIPKLPVDPINNCTTWAWSNTPTDQTCYAYFYGNVGRFGNPPEYDLVAELEEPGNPQRSELKNYKYYFTPFYQWSDYVVGGKLILDAGDRLFGH